MKSYTDLEQSKKLAELLPITSIDFAWNIFSDGSTRILRMDDWQVSENAKSNVEIIPCWSLAALFDVLPYGTDVTKDKSDTENEKYMCTVLVNDSLVTTFANNPVDACVEMILKLNKNKML